MVTHTLKIGLTNPVSSMNSSENDPSMTLLFFAPIPIQNSIRQMALEAMQKGEQRYSSRTTPRATNQNIEVPGDCKTGGGGTLTSESQSSALDGLGLPNDSFMRVPSKEIVDAAVGQFI